MNVSNLYFAILLVGSAHLHVNAQTIEFEGVPLVKVEVSDGKATTQSIPKSKQAEFGVRIVRDGDRYLWASRNNLTMLKQVSGSYATYVATSGAGYVRVFVPEPASMSQGRPSEKREHEFTYTEHMLYQLGSLTYFGN